MVIVFAAPVGFEVVNVLAMSEVLLGLVVVFPDFEVVEDPANSDVESSDLLVLAKPGVSVFVETSVFTTVEVLVDVGVTVTVMPSKLFISVFVETNVFTAVDVLVDVGIRVTVVISRTVAPDIAYGTSTSTSLGGWAAATCRVASTIHVSAEAKAGGRIVKIALWSRVAVLVF